MSKRRIAMLVAVIMSIFLCTSVFADTASDLADLNKDIKSKKSELKEQKSESQDLKEEIKSLEGEIESTQKDIEELDEAIDGAEDDLSRLKVELEEAKKKVEEQNTNLNARLRAMYKNGTVGFLDVLLQSGDFSEFLSNLTLVQKVFASDEEVLAELEDAHEAIEAKTKEVESLRAQLSSSRSLAEETKGDLKDQQADLDDKKDALDSDIAQTQEELDKMEAEAEKLNEIIRQQSSSSEDSEYKGKEGKMCWPAPQYTRISCYFGWRTHPITGKKNYHGGTDLAAPGGSPILAAEDGVVIIASHHWSYGNYVVIDHGGGICTLYAHSSKLLVSKGQTVKRGEKIALVGTTGCSTGNHLHFEVRKDGVRVNGLAYIQ